MAESAIPHYLYSAVAESGDAQAEVLLSLVEATEAQTEVMERIAVALEAPSREALVEACRTALACCQDGDVYAAAHVLHSALSEVGEV